MQKKQHICNSEKHILAAYFISEMDELVDKTDIFNMAAFQYWIGHSVCFRDTIAGIRSICRVVNEEIVSEEMTRMQKLTPDGRLATT